ncbi:unnamed protein product [Auanema sp. JU1783]|nr:unnamed protein product [Auanema sp. JU1783]
MLFPSGWIFPQDSIKSTPSIKQGCTYEADERFRREGIKMIMSIGQTLRLKVNPTLATAAVYFHRFYMSHSFQNTPRELAALGCLFLAGKVEETPKKVRDLLRVAQTQFPSLYTETKPEDIMGIERVLLRTLKFDLQVDHPYKYLLEYIQKHNLSAEISKRYMQAAYAFVNDSYATTLCLLWEPQVLAVAFIDLSFHMNTKTYTPKPDWWDEHILNLTSTIVEDICHVVLDFYSVSKSEKFDFGS